MGFEWCTERKCPAEMRNCPIKSCSFFEMRRVLLQLDLNREFYALYRPGFFIDSGKMGEFCMTTPVKRTSSSLKLHFLHVIYNYAMMMICP